MVNVIKASEAAELVARLEAVRSKIVPVDGAVLLQIHRALEAALRHFWARDAMNAASHMEAIKSSPLTLNLTEARNRLREILRDAAPSSDSTPKEPAQSERSSEKTTEKGE